MTPPFVRRLPSNALGSFLWLAAPFAVFLRYHGLAYLEPEALMCFAVIGVAALVLGVLGSASRLAEATVFAGVVTAFLDVQYDALTGRALIASVIVCVLIFRQLGRHLPVLATVVGATMLLSTVLGPLAADKDVRRSPVPAAGRDLPLILHIVLDEHIAIDALPLDGGAENLPFELRSFFQRNGFQLFGGAYSEFFNTPQSLSHLLNFSTAKHVPALYSRQSADHSWALQRNAHFRELAKRGYAVHVYQSSYLDVCVDPHDVVSCETYNFTGVGALTDAGLSSANKARVIGTIYLVRSTWLAHLRRLYGSVQRGLIHAGIVLPVWTHGPRHVGPLVAMQVMDVIERRLKAARRGDYVFAHLLLPHNPYIYDEHCELTSPSQWLERNAFDLTAGQINTHESRKRRYQLYADQLRCTYRRLSAILKAIPTELKDDAVVIIHGDHGSRITLTEPSSFTSAQRSAADYADGYSTLFAVRAPGLPAADDSRFVPISCLFERFANSGFTVTPDAQMCSAPMVFLLGAGTDVATAERPPFRPGAEWQMTVSPP